jgi:hypothetical protein
MTNVTDNNTTVERPTSFARVLLHNGALQEFDPAKMIFSPRVERGKGGAVVTATYPVDTEVSAPNGKNYMVRTEVPVTLQTPPLPTTFGLSTREHEKGKPKTSIDVTFRENISEEADLFHQTMRYADYQIRAAAKRNKKQWFTKPVTDELLDFLYTPIVRKNVSRSNGNEYSDSMRAKLRRSTTGSYSAMCYDVAHEAVDIESIVPQSMVRLATKMSGIWFTDNTYVPSLDVLQAQYLGGGQPQSFMMAVPTPPPTPVHDPASEMGESTN